MSASTPSPAPGPDVVMMAELEHLNSPLGLLRGFNPALEAQFREWLHKRMHRLLRQYMWALLLLGAMTFCGNWLQVLWLAPDVHRAQDSVVFSPTR